MIPSRSPPSIPLVRKPRFPGSPSTRDVKPEHKYLVRAHRRIRAQAVAAKSFKLKFANERVEERDCREKIQEEVGDYRGTDQSPKRKAVESTTIRSLTRSLCSLPCRARPAPIFVSFDEAMDVDTANDNDDSVDVDSDFDMDDSSFDNTMSQLVQLMSALYLSTPQPPPQPPPPPPITMSQLAQLMSALYVSTPPPPPYVPAPTPAPSFPPGLHVPASEASKAAMAEEAVPSAAAPVANGAASKGKAAHIRIPWNVLFEQLRASRASERGHGEQDDDEGWLV
ncbi:hypothetical protein PsYK624_067880 [Phanerochaete sordida]|uniref:Uncharacterized protein n=1 Tax=Phanerochaete sordida TaxID=48140 RepID=A0A9P3GA81_9APHY|nr:hypothetical protein PsYK624_067880 [Phanerochaete sordida]